MKITYTNFKPLPLAFLIPPPFSIKLPNPLFMKYLLKIIEEKGQFHPINVRALQGTHYEILPDSSIYIYNALVKLGITTAICCDCGEITEEQTLLFCLRQDLINFEPDDLNIAETLVKLNKSYTTEQLHSLVPLSQAKISTYLKLLSTDWNKLLAEDNDRREKSRLKRDASKTKNLPPQPLAAFEPANYKPLSPNSILNNY
jgi:hypothetical protein